MWLLALLLMAANLFDSAGNPIAAATMYQFSNANGVSFGTSQSSITASVSSLSFSNANGVTFGINAGTLTASAAGGGAAISASNTSQNTGTVSFANSNGVTFGLSNNGVMTGSVQTNYLTTAALSTQTLGFSLSGNTSTTNSSQISNGAYALAGGNGVTLAQSNNTVSISVATNYQSQGAYLTTADLSANSSNYIRQWSLLGNNTAGTLSSLQGTQLDLSGGNGVTLSGNSNTIIFSVATNYQSQAAYLTTADLSANSSAYIQKWSLLGNSSGTTTTASLSILQLSGGQGITLSGNSNTIVFSVGSYITTADLSANSSNYMSAWSLAGAHAAGTTQSAVGTQLYLSGGNNVTLSGNSNTIVISALGATGTVAFSDASANVAGTNSTMWANVDHQHAAVAAYGASNTGNTLGNTGVSAGTWVLAGSNAVTVSQSTGAAGVHTLWLSAGNTASTFKAGGTNSGNTAGTTGSVDQSCVFVASQNITLSQSNDAANHSATITLLGAPLYTNSLFEPIPWDNAAITTSSSMGINSLVLQPFVLDNYLSFNQCNVIGSIDFTANTFDGSGNTFSISIGGASSHGFTYSASMTNANYINVVLFTKGSGSNTDALFTAASTQASFLSCYSMVMNLSNTAAAAGWSCSAKSSLSVQVSYPAMTSGQAVNGASSWTTWAPGYSTNSSSTTASQSSSTSTANASTISIGSAYPANISSFFQSHKLIPIPFATSLTPGEYWLGVLRSTGSTFNSASANANVGANNSYSSTINGSSGATRTHPIAYAGSTASIVSSLGFFGQASNASMVPSPGHGLFTVNTYATNSTYINAAGQPNGAIALSQVLSQTSMFRSWFQLANNRI